MDTREGDAETPYLEVELHLDPLRADMQLQQALMMDSASDCASEPNSSHKRKHSHVSSSMSYATPSSDVSGRFDDAEEELETEQLAYDEDDGDDDDAAAYYGTQSAHSSKRRRSNDWPLRNEVVYNEHGLRVPSGDHAAVTNRSSPRSRTLGSKDKANGSPCLRYRRSRFIEGSMNDRVSEKPPSIFVRDDEIMQGKQLVHDSPAQRHSGIFKFGKAIAAAFNPFGMWENVSDIWKPPQDRPKTQKEIMKERQTQAQKAYAELKKSGYRGTKGNFGQTSNGVNPEIADQTWKAIQEKMEYRSSGNHSRNTSASLSTRDGYQPSFNDNKEMLPTPGRPDQVSSFKSSLQDLRKARSALSIPSIKRRDGSPQRRSLDTPSEDFQRPSVHKQRSRKELARQAKLMKKVSNLEDKLERVRRELREMTAELEAPPVPPLPVVAYDALPPRRFVPGALPSLPSERLLNNQAESGPEPVSAPAPAHSIRCVESGNESEHEQARTRKLFSTPKARRLPKEQRHPVSQDASPLKRKSPDVNRKQSNDIPPEEQYQDEGAETDRSSRKKQSARKSKAQKYSQGDSPGAVERKQLEESDSTALNKPKSPKHLAMPRTPTPLRRVPNLKKRSSPCSKMKKSRAESPCEKMTDEIAEPPRLAESNRSSPQPFYLQSQPQLNPTADPDAVIISPGKGWGFNGEENIPPVPPVPQELIANTKRDSSCSGALTSIKGSELGPGNITLRSLCQEHRVQHKLSDNFQWPDDIF
ncbi:hypothetical protein DTO195F2_3409 [Paecilomyces variotii]|nr:hypothetical protein DTO195F2_3409 [Paecilomyces variotii]KAJ9373241.1 hypothetical protein DTO282E5_1977 [Paecilomyces variotii]